MLPRARKALLSAMWIICVFYYYSFWPLVLHQKGDSFWPVVLHQKGDVIIMQQKQLYNVCTYIMTSQEQLERSPDRTWWTKGTLHMHIKRRSSLFVSYLYNYFKISTDFGFPFREKSIKPCSPGLSGWVSYHHIVTITRQSLNLVDVQMASWLLTQRGKKTSWSQFHHGLYRICLHEWKMIHRSKSMGFSYAVLLPRWSGFSRTDVLILKTLPYVCIVKLLCMQGYEMLQEFQSTISGSLLGYLLSGSWPKGAPYVIILCHILKFSE